MQTTPTNKKHKKTNSLSSANLMPVNKQARSILHQRAENFSIPEIVTEEKGNLISYVHFRLGENEHYGIAFAVLKEVMPMTTLTKLPCAPEFVAGVINWRGSLVTIINLSKFFHLNIPNVKTTSFIIIVSIKDIPVGIIADHIEGDNAYDPATLDPPLPATGDIKSEYIIGLHNGKTAILNLEKIAVDIQDNLKLVQGVIP